MNIKKALSTASFFAFFLTSSSSAMLITVPERSVLPAHHSSQALAMVGSTPKVQPLTLRLQTSQLPVPIVPAVSSFTHLNKAVAEQFNKAAPYLAVCAFAVQYAIQFSRSSQLHVSPQTLARLTPNEQRLHAILQKNEEIKQKLKNIGWQAIFSLALLNSKFSESYEFLQTANDARIAIHLVDPSVRASALNHLQGRFIARASSFVSAQLSKLLLFAYRCASPPVTHPTVAKTVIDVAATASIYIVSPIIVNRCTQPHGLVAIMAREKAFSAYNYLPNTLKYRLLALKNWLKGYS